MTNHACPLCGHQPKSQKRTSVEGEWHRPWCNRCGFGEDDWDSYSSEEDAVNAWNRRVRRELAEQALALRAASRAMPDARDHYTLVLDAIHMVMRDYAAFADKPLRLPGEDAT